MTELKQKLDDAEVKLGEMDPEAEEFYDLIDLMGAWEEQLASFEPEKDEFTDRKSDDRNGVFT